MAPDADRLERWQQLEAAGDRDARAALELMSHRDELAALALALAHRVAEQSELLTAAAARDRGRIAGLTAALADAKREVEQTQAAYLLVKADRDRIWSLYDGSVEPPT